MIGLVPPAAPRVLSLGHVVQALCLEIQLTIYLRMKIILPSAIFKNLHNQSKDGKMVLGRGASYVI